MKQPHRTAVQIFDQKTIPLLRDEYRIRQVTKVTANSIAELAAGLEIDAAALTATIEQFNAACRPGTFPPPVLDRVRTERQATHHTTVHPPTPQGPFEASFHNKPATPS